MQRVTNAVALERLKRVALQGAKPLDGLPPDLTEALAILSRAHTAGERRACRRVQVCLPIRYRTQSNARMASSAIADLSKGGVFVRALELGAEGEAVAGAFMLSEGDRTYQVLFRGRVAWVAKAGAGHPPGPGIGVRFSRVVVNTLPRARGSA